MRYVILALALILPIGSPAIAATLLSKSTDACGALLEVGLKTTGWKDRGNSEFSCITPYKDIGAGLPLANNLAYYAEGNAKSVQLVKLILNINQRNQAQVAHKELLSAASLLSVKATGKELPKNLKDAITRGTSISQKLGASSVQILRINWPTGRGYEVKVIFE